jgi:hypothetical protein
MSMRQVAEAVIQDSEEKRAAKDAARSDKD